MRDRQVRQNHSSIRDDGLHLIEDELAETWLAELAAAGIAELEAYLAKHAAFLGFLDAREA